METAPSAIPLNGYILDSKEGDTDPPMVVPSCCGIPKRATDLCDHFQIRPPVPIYDAD